LFSRSSEKKAIHKKIIKMKFIVFAVLLIAASASAAFTSLSAGEIESVKTAWKPVSANLAGTAESVFYTYLKKFPANQDKFETLKGHPLDEVKGTANFKLIAGRIFNVFDNAVKAIGDDKAFKKIVADVAKPHVSRPITHGSYNDLRGIIVESLHLDAAGKTLLMTFT
jgi:hypothetical protein